MLREESKKSNATREAATASPRATYQDVLDAPAHKVAEIIDGTLYTLPRPASPHARASSRLGNLIGPPFDFDDGNPGGWCILDEPELHLGEDIVVPDIAGWRRERMPEVPDVAYFTLTPDWVCEVLSPSTQMYDFGKKRAIYARAGVSYLWLVNPIARSLEAFLLRGAKFELIDMVFDDDQVSLPPFEAISFNLGDLWLSSGPGPAVHKELPSELTAAT